MLFNDCRTRLARSADAIRSLTEGLTPQEARWRPGEGKWSVLEVVSHLADEEVEDFRTRLEYTLTRPGEAWPAIDPEGWASDRAYNEGDLAETLGRFLRERAASLRWLEGLADPDWDCSFEHPQAGRLTAGDLLVSWTAHDLLHLRQISGVRYAALEAGAAPYAAAYAGRW